eukprot:3700883-Pyramimonas_sp.AAC.1
MAEWRLGHDELVPLRNGKGGKIKKVTPVPLDVLVHAGGAKARAKQGKLMEGQAVPPVPVHTGGGR